MKQYLLLLLGLSWAFPLQACKCDDPDSISLAESIGMSQLVVLGKVKHKSLVSLAESLNPQKLATLQREKSSYDKNLLKGLQLVKIELDVLQVFKGQQIYTQLIVYTAVSSASCGFSYEAFQEGQSYVFFGNKQSYLYSFLSHQATRKDWERAGTYWINHCSKTGLATPERIKELKQIRG